MRDHAGPWARRLFGVLWVDRGRVGMPLALLAMVACGIVLVYPSLKLALWKYFREAFVKEVWLWD